MGYDINPSYNKRGDLAWLSMKRDGFESDNHEADGKDVILHNIHANIPDKYSDSINKGWCAFLDGAIVFSS
jgi:hypothetical protein